MAGRYRLAARALALLAALVLLAGVAAAAALAHSKQEETHPADGAVLGQAPDVISVSFDEPISITSIRLENEEGDSFELERTDAMAPVTEFRATPPALPEGRYSVEWRGLSSDGHPMKGRFSFEIAP